MGSIPLAATLDIKVVSIDHRMGPKAKFRAASEDVAAVYKAVLKRYKPSLTAQSIAWFQKEHIPNPGAIGILCASVGQIISGDSASFTGV